MHTVISVTLRLISHVDKVEPPSLRATLMASWAMLKRAATWQFPQPEDDRLAVTFQKSWRGCFIADGNSILSESENITNALGAVFHLLNFTRQWGVTFPISRRMLKRAFLDSPSSFDIYERKPYSPFIFTLLPFIDDMATAIILSVNTAYSNSPHFDAWEENNKALCSLTAIARGRQHLLGII